MDPLGNLRWAQRARRLAAALRKAEARVWREAAWIIDRTRPGQHDQRHDEFIERAEKLERGE